MVKYLNNVSSENVDFATSKKES